MKIDRLYRLYKYVLIFAITFASLIEPELKAVGYDSTKTEDTSKISSGALYKVLGFTAVYYPLSMYVLGKTWYKDRGYTPLHFDNDNSGYLQIDKFGHIFGSYVYSYAGLHLMREIGFTRDESLYFGSSIGFILMLPIEIMDGLHEGYGFSWGDIIANSMGSLLVLGNELLFNEQLIRYKFSYWESPYSAIANGYLGENSFDRIFKDYNGHTYWLSVPINSIISNDLLPSWLCLSAGYSANGMYGEYGNINEYKGILIPKTERYRQFFLSLDIDWSKIETDSGFLKAILSGLSFIKFPFPAVEYNTKGKILWRWIYF